MAAATTRTLVALSMAGVTTFAIVAASAATATTRTPVKPSVTGSAKIFDGRQPNDDIRLMLDARALSVAPDQIPRPYAARGTIRISHWVANGNFTVWAEGNVDCVMTGGRTATLTAVITRTSPHLKEWRKQRFGVTVFDGGRDQVGVTGPVKKLSKCMAPRQDGAPVMAPAPFSMVQSGGYQVKPGTGPGASEL